MWVRPALTTSATRRPWRQRTLELLQRGQQLLGGLRRRRPGARPRGRRRWRTGPCSRGRWRGPRRRRGSAITSLAFMFDEVPEPVWKTSMGNWSSCSPAAISSPAAAMRSATSASSRPSSALVRAAAALTRPSIRTTGAGTRSPGDGEVVHCLARLRAPQLLLQRPCDLSDRSATEAIRRAPGAQPAPERRRARVGPRRPPARAGARARARAPWSGSAPRRPRRPGSRAAGGRGPRARAGPGRPARWAAVHVARADVVQLAAVARRRAGSPRAACRRPAAPGRAPRAARRGPRPGPSRQAGASAGPPRGSPRPPPARAPAHEHGQGALTHRRSYGPPTRGAIARACVANPLHFPRDPARSGDRVVRSGRGTPRMAALIRSITPSPRRRARGRDPVLLALRRAGRGAAVRRGGRSAHARVRRLRHGDAAHLRPRGASRRGRRLRDRHRRVDDQRRQRGRRSRLRPRAERAGHAAGSTCCEPPGRGPPGCATVDPGRAAGPRAGGDAGTVLADRELRGPGHDGRTHLDLRAVRVPR